MQMKLASFFILSLGLHASALVCPVEIFVRHQAPPIRVTMFSLEQKSGGTAAQSAQAKGVAPGRARLNPPNRSKRSVQTPPPLKPKIIGAPSPQVLPTETTTTLNEHIAALISPVANPAAPVHGGALSTNPGNAAQRSGTNALGGDGFGSGGHGLGAGAKGAGSANGNGSRNTAVSIQARYSETPKPNYPESARRDGREGRVLLRVLVDHRGRIKFVEINRSSGDEALDRAAVEAVKRWRFHPARNGDEAVESWLRIPIEFRLADAQGW
jgi:protein TonB